MFVSIWLNTVAAVQMFYIERIFVFFMTLFWKKMGKILSASKPNFHSRLSKRVLKILSIYRKNIFGKQLSEAICSKCVFRLLHAPESQIFPTKLNMTVIVVKLFSGDVQKSSDEFYRKTPMQESLFNKVLPLQVKERLLHMCFPVSFTNYFNTLFFAKSIWVTTSSKYSVLFNTSTSFKKCFFNLGYFKYFWDKHCELLVNSYLWIS